MKNYHNSASYQAYVASKGKDGEGADDDSDRRDKERADRTRGAAPVVCTPPASLTGWGWIWFRIVVRVDSWG